MDNKKDIFEFDDESFGQGIEDISFDDIDMENLESDNNNFEETEQKEVKPQENSNSENSNFEETEQKGSDSDNISFDDGIIEDTEIVEGDKESSDSSEDYEVVHNENNFISDTGDIVVMDTSENGDNFKLVYVDIEKIAIVRRIRKNNNVEDLVKSIKSTGLLNPVTVAPTATEGLYVLLDGYRRILACARAGKRRIPCVVNTKVNTPEIPVLEALYNHNKSYNIKEMVAYISYLEKEKGIMSASMIEYLLQMANGDYTKLKDILNDNDEDIVDKLFSGIYNIETAFKKLEQRRKKESAEEKELQKAEKVYGDAEESGASDLEGSGEEVDEGPGLTDEEIKDLAISPENLDDGLEEASLNEMVEEGKDTPGFEAHKQKVGEREYIDPVIRKTVMARDNFTCSCCKRGGESFVDVLDYHHILPVFLGGADTPENGVTLCLTCHRLVHLYSVGDLHLPSEKTQDDVDKLEEEDRAIYKDEQMRFKRIVKLGQVIRDGMAKKGIKREQFKKDHPIGNVGRNKPGKIQEQS